MEELKKAYMEMDFLYQHYGLIYDQAKLVAGRPPEAQIALDIAKARAWDAYYAAKGTYEALIKEASHAA